MVCCCLPPERVELTVKSKKETERAKSQYGLLWLKSAVKTIKSNWTKKESAWAWVKLGSVHFDSGSNCAKESIWVGTISS